MDASQYTNVIWRYSIYERNITNGWYQLVITYSFKKVTKFYCQKAKKCSSLKEINVFSNERADTKRKKQIVQFQSKKSDWRSLPNKFKKRILRQLIMLQQITVGNKPSVKKQKKLVDKQGKGAPLQTTQDSKQVLANEVVHVSTL